jgi:hypothetical protein
VSSTEDDDWDENPPILRTDDYAAEWDSVVDDAREDPVDGLPALLDILSRMLADYGGPGDEESPEVAAPLMYANEVRLRIDGGEDVPIEDAAAAVDGLVELWTSFETSSEQLSDGAGTIEPLAADQIQLEDEAGATGETEEDR